MGAFVLPLLLGGSQSLSTNSILLDQGLNFVCKYLISKLPVVQKRSIPSVLRRACIARICAAHHLPRFLLGRSCRSRCSHSIGDFTDIFLKSIDVSAPKLRRVLEPTSLKHPPVCPSIDAFLRDIDYVVAIFPSRYRWRWGGRSDGGEEVTNGGDPFCTTRRGRTRTEAKHVAMRACCASSASEEATQKVVARLREQVERRRAVLRRGGGAEDERNGTVRDNQGLEQVRASLRESRSEIGRLKADMGVMQREYELAKKKSNESQLLALQLLERSKNGLRALEEKNERITELTNKLEQYDTDLKEKSRELTLAQDMLARKSEENVTLKGEILRLKNALKAATANITRWTSSLFQLKHIVGEETSEEADDEVAMQIQRIQDRYTGAFVVLHDIAELTKNMALQAAEDNEALQICTPHAASLAASESESIKSESETENDAAAAGTSATVDPDSNPVDMDIAEIEDGDGWVLYRFKS